MGSDFRETLYTVDEQGRRKWVYAAIEKGRHFYRRQFVAYFLMGLYLLFPWITINGRQGILLNIVERRFVFFGQVFWATDMQFLFLILGVLAFSLFFFTAVFGRVWCGWACPETVFLEFLFRPIERWVEGTPAQRKRLDSMPWTWEKIKKKVLKHSLCAFWSWVIASTALAYFIGREPLLLMMSDWPHKNLGAFSATLAMMGLMAFQFGWFREQFCTVLCPYARFQSVLMDSDSIVVGYDVQRGEPRGKLARKEEAESKGDCVDCGLCVRVCPTGIDIRNGLQLECVACTACIDACNAIMKKVEKKPGLIRYDSERALLGETEKQSGVRIRAVAYGVLLAVFVGSLAASLLMRSLSEMQIVRGASVEPYRILGDGRVSNHLLLKVSNKSDESVSYFVSAVRQPEVEVLTPLVPLLVEAGQMTSVPLFVNFPKDLLQKGKLKVTALVKGTDGSQVDQVVTLLGPES